MPARPAIGPGGAAWAAVLALGCLGVGWLSVRAAAIELLPPAQPALATIAPDDPDRVLGLEMTAFVAKQGKLGDSDYAAVARAAAAAPLDARPYMLMATRHILSEDGHPVLSLLEAGRRLDPRLTWIRFYLLDQYLRVKRYADAAGEFAALSKLIGSVGGAIAAELARMSIDPATAQGVRITLARDPQLENAVLIQLAANGASPKLIFGMATPAGLAMAGKPEGWGTAMVTTLIAKQDYRGARGAWQKIYGASVAAGVYDGDLRGLPGGAPFNWTLIANEVGATDRGDGGLSVNYYGRQPGELANQLLILPAGQYRLTFAIAGAPASNGSPTLSWTIGCDKHESPLLLDGPVPPAGDTARGVAMTFAVPADNCGAQWLRLIGNQGQVAAALTATIRHVAVQPIGAKP